MPALRGKEKDRRPGDVLAEVEALVAEGVLEVTLLGQNVNSYGVEFGDRLAFGKLLRACGEIDGLERVRFTSPHPKDFTDDVIAAMAETPNVMPSLHMPLQSGSDRVLKAMRRSYRQERYLGIIDRVRAAMPDAAITTDIIVGFPGETEDDFAADPRRRARRPGSPARSPSSTPSAPARPPPTMPDQLPEGRSCRSATSGSSRCRSEISWAENKRQVGRTLEVLVAEGEGRKDGATHRLSGRAPRQPARALRGPGRRRARRGPATSSPSRSPTPRRTTWSPTARSAASAAPGPATRGRPAGRYAGPGRRAARHADGRAPRRPHRPSPTTCG